MTIERDGQTWLEIKAWAEKRIEQERDELEKFRPEEMHAKSRGRIEELRALLALGDTVKAAPLPSRLRQSEIA